MVQAECLNQGRASADLGEHAPESFGPCDQGDHRKTDLNIESESLERSKHRRVRSLTFAINSQAVPRRSFEGKSAEYRGIFSTLNYFISSVDQQRKTLL